MRTSGQRPDPYHRTEGELYLISDEPPKQSAQHAEVHHAHDTASLARMASISRVHRRDRDGRGAAPKALDQEAQRFAAQYYGRYLTQCGEDYYLSYQYDGKKPYIMQYHGLTTSVRPQNLTTADRLNGLEWAGFSQIKVEASRVYDLTGRKWDLAWISGWPNAWDLMARVTKERGKWTIEPYCLGHPVGYSIGARQLWSYTQRVDCNNVPK
jgi:hypothetical protein